MLVDHVRHPTTLIRNELIRRMDGYRDFRASEDYDLWQRMSEITQLANLDQTIVLYRLHGDNISSLPNKSRSIERNDIRQRAITHILGNNAKINWQLYWNDPYYSGRTIEKVLRTINKKLSPNEKEIIRKETGQKLYKKARSISRDKYGQKVILFLDSFFLYPSLIKKFIRRNWSHVNE